jgi:hypothetical protein
VLKPWVMGGITFHRKGDPFAVVVAVVRSRYRSFAVTSAFSRWRASAIALSGKLLGSGRVTTAAARGDARDSEVGERRFGGGEGGGVVAGAGA